jgi:hypothetical protein
MKKAISKIIVYGSYLVLIIGFIYSLFIKPILSSADKLSTTSDYIYAFLLLFCVWACVYIAISLAFLLFNWAKENLKS